MKARRWLTAMSLGVLLMIVGGCQTLNQGDGDDARGPRYNITVPVYEVAF